jgi:hypothetical protein
MSQITSDLRSSGHISGHGFVRAWRGRIVTIGHWPSIASHEGEPKPLAKRVLLVPTERDPSPAERPGSRGKRRSLPANDAALTEAVDQALAAFRAGD